MKAETTIPVKRFIILLSAMIIFSASGSILAQGPEDPPRPISVSISQDLAFGAFSIGALGGSVTIDPVGSRASTGDVGLLFFGPFAPAVFQITGNTGTVITITFGSDVALTRVGGGSMILHIDSSLPESPLVLTDPYPVPKQVSVGATLSVGGPAANPPGTYNGTFQIVFNQN